MGIKRVKNFMGICTAQYQEGVRVRVGKQLGILKFSSCRLLLHYFLCILNYLLFVHKAEYAYLQLLN